MKEIWKQYKDTNYEVSNMGKVRNKATGKEIKLFKAGKRKECDYLKVNIYINGKQFTKSIHRLVLETFIGENKLEVDHINGIRNDNRLENLEYVTREENHQRYLNNGGNSQKKPVKGISLDGKEEIRFDSLWQAGKYIKSIYKKRTIDAYCNNIKLNINGKSKYAYGYIWEFIENT